MGCRVKTSGRADRKSPGEAPGLILASTSVYRRELLLRLGLPFEVISPDVDESFEDAPETAVLAERLARLKARAVARSHPDAVIIGSDQVAECEGRRLGKPGTMQNALAQLEAISGRQVLFHTAVAVIANGRENARVVTTRVSVKSLDKSILKTYLEFDRPLDCAGALKSESLGIVLTSRIESDDPTALVGLPLIALVELLEEAGIRVMPSQDWPDR